LPANSRQILTGREFFPALISGPFHHGLVIVFSVATGLAAIAAVASLLRGGKYIHATEADTGPDQRAASQPTTQLR
jgi:hypothetical protein